MPLAERRSIQTLAASVDENPTHGWYTYWWDAAVGRGTQTAPYRAGDMADYPSLGVDSVSIDATIKVGGKVTLRRYPHISMFPAHAIETGQGPTVSGWLLYPTDTGGLRIRTTRCPASPSRRSSPTATLAPATSSAERAATS